MEFQELQAAISKFGQQDILVVGDLMIDEYLWGTIERISPEAPVQVVDVEKEEYTLGGAGNVVKNLISFGSSVDIVSVIADGGNGDVILAELEKLDVSMGGLSRDPNRISSRKTRIMSSSNNQQILRVDRETSTPICEADESNVINFASNNIDRWGAIILCDYAKGVLTPRVLQNVIQIANKHHVPIIVDPKGNDYKKYHGATVITPNKQEAEIASGIAFEIEADVRKAGRKLLGELNTEAILITRGKEGMTLLQRDGEVMDIPTKARAVYDVTGAGDTVVSVLGLGIASGLSFEDTAEIANIAAGIVVGKVGTATASGQEILEHVGEHRIQIGNKLKEREALRTVVEQERAAGKTIVFTNGCFDLLHVGHVKLLQGARALGDILILGLNSDESVRRLKRGKRPIMPQEQRAHILAALGFVDYVTIFCEDTPLELIKEIRPDILVKGKDYEETEVVGREVVESYGGRVELLDLVKGASTSALIDRIIEHYHGS